MQFPKLVQTIETAILGAGIVVSVQSTILFASKYYRTQAWMHLAGLMAALCGLTYSVFRLTYWSIGADALLDCNALLIVGGILLNLSIAFALLHLLLRAEALNHADPRWPVYRIVAIIMSVVNLIAFVMYLFMRTFTTFRDSDNILRCAFVLNSTALKFRYVVQALNHAFQTSLFVYPLLLHIRAHRLTSPNLVIYVDIVTRATTAMICATTFTIAVSIVVVFYDQNLDIRRSIVTLLILDMILTLASITYAIDIKPANINEPQRRSSELSMLSNNDC